MAQDRGLKNRIPISSVLDKEIYRRLKEYSDKTGIPISKILDKSVSLYLDTVEKK